VTDALNAPALGSTIVYAALAGFRRYLLRQVEIEAVAGQTGATLKFPQLIEAISLTCHDIHFLGNLEILNPLIDRAASALG
jgi:hypothetical protein